MTAAVSLPIEGITRHVSDQTNKHFILSLVPDPPRVAHSPLLRSQTVEKGWLFTCCLNLIKNSPFSQKSFSFKRQTLFNLSAVHCPIINSPLSVCSAGLKRAC